MLPGFLDRAGTSCALIGRASHASLLVVMRLAAAQRVLPGGGRGNGGGGGSQGSVQGLGLTAPTRCRAPVLLPIMPLGVVVVVV